MQGLVLTAAGLVVLLAGRVGRSGRLPGNLVFRTGRTTIRFPVVTSLGLSILPTVVLNLLYRR